MNMLFDDGGVQLTTRVPQCEVQVPGRRLQCICGHRLAGFDFELIEPNLVRAICTRCHTNLLTIEMASA
jgi:hypothetical protein